MQHQQDAAQRSHARNATRMRQNTAPSSSGRGFFQADDVPRDGAAQPSSKRSRKKTNSFMAGVLARRAVAMDLLPADDADLGMYEFFRPQAAPFGLEHYGDETKEEEEEEEEEEDLETGAAGEGGEEAELTPQDGAGKKKKKLFKPLIFAPRKMMSGAGGGHGHPHGGGGAFCDVVASTQQMKGDNKKPTNIMLAAGEDKDGTDVLDASEAIPLTTAGDEPSEKKKSDEFIDDGDDVDEDSQDGTIVSQKHYDDSHLSEQQRRITFLLDS